jgi:urease accessory protein
MAEALVRHQRAEGEILLRVGPYGLKRLREAHAAKLRLPPGSREAILINTGGGLAGGDSFRFDITAEEGSALTVTTQAAERVYRSLGPAAEVRVKLALERGATLTWMPQETILFDGAALSRSVSADVAGDAQLLMVESVILGREAMGETIAHARFSDHWRIRQDGKLIFADDLRFEGRPPASAATLKDARAFATVLHVCPQAEEMVEDVRAAIGENGAASAWCGKIVARLAARDGFTLRKSLIPALGVMMGSTTLPKTWAF